MWGGGWSYRTEILTPFFLKMRNDLRCENCGERESTYLLYYEKYEREIGKYSLINPSFVCSECSELFLDVNILHENRPKLISFEVIANVWDSRLIGLTSKKKYEFSAFRNPYFRKKLHRVRFIWKDREKDAA